MDDFLEDPTLEAINKLYLVYWNTGKHLSFTFNFFFLSKTLKMGNSSFLLIHSCGPRGLLGSGVSKSREVFFFPPEFFI